MEIEFIRIPIKDIVAGYVDNDEDGVIGYLGKLNIRPAYQREFIYNDSQRNLVIDSISKKRPLNTMYWGANDDGTYEIIDGQQRTISFCQFCNNDFSMEFQPGVPRMFANLPNDMQESILNYECHVYICKGTPSEKLEWFHIINIAQKPLTEQELLNANYTGRWLTDAKKKFSKTNCVAFKIANKYLTGTPIRQEYLETALKWISNNKNNGIAQYMSDHQQDPDALELWTYFQTVINWIQAKFPHYRKEMKGIDWGLLYNTYSANKYDPEVLEKRIAELMADDDVTAKKGIYEFVLSGETLEKTLNIRKFTDSQKRTVYERQKGICPICGRHFELEEMEGDHITPWRDGGKTLIENLQMLCKECNRKKGAK